MRLMMRWSPISSVFSMEPEGITRAWPMVPLIRRKARPTQNQAMISRWIFVFTGRFSSSCVFFFSAFTFHRHWALGGRGFTAVTLDSFAGLAVGSAFAHFQLHEIGRIVPRITRRTKLAFGIAEGLPERWQGYIAERIGAEEFADFLGRVGGGNQFFARRRVHAV